MKELTIFTPTYNRAYLLPRLYQSLCNQTNKNFIWLVIDDGSTDNTKKLIEQWKSEDKITIQYHWKENGGMHTGHNAAYALIETELNVCIDSDDMMPENAVFNILNIYENLPDKENYSGLVGLDTDSNGDIIGDHIPSSLTRGSYYDLYSKTSGDKKFVLRTSEVLNYPKYPEFKNEKLVPLGILYIMMGEKKPFIFSNEIFCIVEYQPNGSSYSIFKQYKQSPRGFTYARNVSNKYSKSLLTIFKNSIHIVSSSIFAKSPQLLLRSPYKLINMLSIPLGILFNLYIRYKIRQYERNI